MIDINNILDRLKSHFNVKSDREIADILGVTSQNITNWKSRNKIPYNEIISICLKEEIDLNELILNKKVVKNINYKEENINNIELLNEKENKIIYYEIKSLISKKENDE